MCLCVCVYCPLVYVQLCTVRFYFVCFYFVFVFGLEEERVNLSLAIIIICLRVCHMQKVSRWDGGRREEEIVQFKD